MKFKKIIAMLLTLSMVLAMGSFTASADETTPLTLFTINDDNTMTVLDGVPTRNFSYSGTGAYMNDVNGNQYTSKGILSATEGEGDTTNTYSVIRHSWLLNNYYTNAYKSAPSGASYFSYASWMEERPVLSFSSKFRVPSDNTSGNTLTFTLNFSKGIMKSATEDKGTSAGGNFSAAVAFNTSNNTITTSASGTSTYTITDLTITRDKWMDVEVRTYLNEDNHPVIGIYIDNDLVRYSTVDTVEIDTISIQDFRLTMDNKKTRLYTPYHFDEMTLKVLDESNIPEIPTNEATTEEKIAQDLESLVAPSSTDLITGSSVNLSTSANNGSTITWTSSHPSIISLDGKVNHLDLQYDTEVTLTATATLEGKTGTKEFKYTVQAEQRKDFLKYTFDNLAEDFNVPVTYINDNGTRSAKTLGTHEGLSEVSFRYSTQATSKYQETATAASKYGDVVDKEGQSLYVSTNTGGSKNQAGTIIANSGYDISTHVSSTNETVLVSGYDMYIPSGTEASLRKGYTRYYIHDGVDEAGKAIKKDFIVYAEISNGRMIFDVTEPSSIATLIPSSAAKSYPEVPSDRWFNVQYIVKLKPNNSGTYSLKIYFILDNVCYSEYEYTLSSLTGMSINRQDFQIFGIGDSVNNIVTGFDNIYTSKVPYYVDVDNFTHAGYLYDISYDETEGTITAASRVPNTSRNYCLALAVYDANGRLQTITSANAVDSEGKMKVVLQNASAYLVKGYKYKSFMFDSLSTLIPQVNAQEVKHK